MLGPPLTGLLEDAAHALRTLRRRPQAPLLGTLGLSVGLGVAAATFSLLDATLLRPLPGANPGELVAIHGFNTKQAAYADVGYSDFKDLADDTQALARVLARTSRPTGPRSWPRSWGSRPGRARRAAPDGRRREGGRFRPALRGHAATCLVAVYVPASRATRFDPLVVLA